LLGFLVDLLKVCITSIQSSNSNLADITGDSTGKSSQFLDELNSLISNATSLTKSLSKLEQVSSGSNKKGIMAPGTNDIDMECGEGSDSNNNTNKVGGGEHSRLGVKDSLQVENCDFKDVILCNLIDDFLLKENEF